MKRMKKLLSLFLTICITLSLMIGWTSATATMESQYVDNEVFQFPDIVDASEIAENRYIGRLKAEEKDLYTFVFQNADGTNTMKVYSHPVKYVDDDGIVRDISLDVKSKSGGGFVTADHEIVTTFGSKLTDGISLEYKDVGIMLVPELGWGTEPTAILSNDGKAVTYEMNDITSFVYELTYAGFKEDIVVAEYTGQTEYKFTLFTNGLSLCEEYGSYYLTDDEGNIEATIGDIIVITADERNNTMGCMTYETVRANQEYTLTIHLNAEYLANENTVYPIRIDPTIEINYDNNGAGAIEDVTIHENETYSGTSGSLFVGRHASGSLSRVLMRFPTLDLSTVISPRIISASVEIRDLLCQGDEDITVCCYTYAETAPSWSENGDTTWDSVGNCLSTYLDEKLISYGQGNVSAHWYSFDITSLARQWADGVNSPSKGIVFKASQAFESQTEEDIQYWVKTFASYNRSGYKPTLTIEYATLNNTYFDTISARAVYATNSGLVYNFSPASTGTYVIETAQPNGVAAQNTVVYLMDSDYRLISKNDDISSNNLYSRVTATLTEGKSYKVLITTYPYNLSYDCYLAIYAQGALCGSISAYASFVKNFNKIGDYTNSYNCLAYATGNTSEWIWPWGVSNPTVDQLTTYMNSIGYEKVDSYNGNCVVAYGTSDSTITHFSKAEIGTVTAKCGAWELMRHIGYNVYFENGAYGIPRAYYVKNTSSLSLSSVDKMDEVNAKFVDFDVKTYLNHLDNGVDLQIRTKLEKVMINQNNLVNSYNLVEKNAESFKVIEKLGVESIPYILNYVLESDSNGLFEAFLVASVAEILNYDILPGSIGSGSVYLCDYVEYSPKYYAFHLLIDINQ